MKKCVFIMAIALLSVGVYGRDFITPSVDSGVGGGVEKETADGNCFYKGYAWEWPGHWTYDWAEIAKITVKMDIGFWIKIKDCEKLELKLKQDSIKVYSGSTTVTISTNTGIDIGLDWASTPPFAGDKDTLTATPPSLPKGNDQAVVIFLKLKNVDLSKYDGGQKCVEVGKITIKVRPQVNPLLDVGSPC
jgi:hypothetical protein